MSRGQVRTQGLPVTQVAVVQVHLGKEVSFAVPPVGNQLHRVHLVGADVASLLDVAPVRLHVETGPALGKLLDVKRVVRLERVALRVPFSVSVCRQLDEADRKQLLRAEWSAGECECSARMADRGVGKGSSSGCFGGSALAWIP